WYLAYDGLRMAHSYGLPGMAPPVVCIPGKVSTMVDGCTPAGGTGAPVAVTPVVRETAEVSTIVDGSGTGGTSPSPASQSPAPTGRRSLPRGRGIPLALGIMLAGVGCAPGVTARSTGSSQSAPPGSSPAAFFHSLYPVNRMLASGLALRHAM